jgi:predicted GNAT family acetyltransferase
MSAVGMPANRWTGVDWPSHPVAMDVRFHHDPAEFWALVRPVFAADPMRHTHGLSAVRRLVEVPDTDAAPSTLLTLWRDGRIAGAAFRIPPWPLGVSAVPADALEIVAEALLERDPDVRYVSGARDVAEPFAEIWAKLTATTIHEVVALRLYRLGTLEPPTVPGAARPATTDDVPLLVAWRRQFEIEAFGEEREHGRAEATLRGSMTMGNGNLLWEVDGQVVAYAAVGLPTDGMSRIGPVYTPPERRGRGYGSAITAAAARWALDAGAKSVILYADVANPISTGIYQRIGFRPVYDQTELRFDR